MEDVRQKYNQRDYPKTKLGFGSTTIASHGCKLDSFAMILGIDPKDLNEQFKKDGCFSGDLLDDTKIAASIGVKFEGKLDKAPQKICIAEVDMSPAPGKQQHFVVWLPKGKIVDPWTGTERALSTYPILNYRVFSFEDLDPMQKELVKAIEKITGKDRGENLNDNEQKDAAKDLVQKYESLKEEIETLETALANNQGNPEAEALLLQANEQILALKTQVEELEATQSASSNDVKAMDALALFIKAIIAKIKP